MSSVRSTGVGVLDKGMAIVDLCERRPSSASDIARALDMTVSTAHRLATALTVHGLLHRDESGVYSLGRRFQSSGIADIGQPVLDRLTQDTRETSQLWVVRGEHRLCVASVMPDAELRVVLLAGSWLPLSEGGSAALALRGELGPDGWAETISTRTPGLGSVSAPVVVGGEVVAAVCVVAPLPRMTKSPGASFGKQVVDAAAEVARRLAG